MSPLEKIIKQRIHHLGPMQLAEFMTLCLLHPEHGYYTSKRPIGAAGDFTTAPEISQMFGEMIGLWLAQCWLDQGKPAPFNLVELGPGRGTLMADILRVGKTVPGFIAAANIHLIEASPTLRQTQKEALADHKIHWLDDIGKLPQNPLFLVANEFFDALPIRQFLRDGENWRERLVGLDGENLSFGLGAPIPVSALGGRTDGLDQQDFVEVNSTAIAIIKDISQHIARDGGVALAIDYGDWGNHGDTLQSVAAHQKTTPLERPGEQDITAHVDFQALAGQAADICVSPMIPQGVFLERLGITARAQQLAQNLSDEALQQHIAAHRRLTHPDEMGNLFKAIAFFAKNAPPPPGFVE